MSTAAVPARTTHASETKTLLERAMESPRGRRVKATDQEIELALGWFTGELTLIQVSRQVYPDSKHHNRSGTYAWLASRLREAFRKGQVTVN